ncbi:MAG: hypothetical protein U1D99_01865, partial [Candidatus Omnitrophota bacterium]|nr:hypothetical protein [Candidatus Omnitrophota bacterium]
MFDKIFCIARQRGIGMLVFLLAVAPVTAWADLTINLIAVNPDEQGKEIDVKYHLPRELEPQDVVDTGPLKVDYDVDRSLYFVYGTVPFGPKESKTFRVKVRDVWVITREEVDILKNQLDQSFDQIKNLEESRNAAIVRDQINDHLDRILVQQQTYSDNIERRIEQYRAYKEEMDQIRNNVYSIDYLVRQSRELEELDLNKTVKLVLEVQNPSKKEEKTVEQKHYLPKEIREEDVIDGKGFDVRFDDKKGMAYLTKKETFQPAEIKRYEIVLKDVWTFPLSKVNDVELRAKEAYQEISEDPAFAESGKYLYDSMVNKLAELRSSQQESLPVQQHIGLYRVNTERYAKAEEDLKKLEEMLAILRAKKLDEMEKGKVKNVLQRL